jgi:site-specific DNA-methyltransferase (adenine-specific)
MKPLYVGEKEKLDKETTENMDRLYCGDCRDILPTIKRNSVNLIVTSPPYADSRKSTYGGIHPDSYVNWFIPIADLLYEVLCENGSFILNIKEKVVDCERHTYVIELILALRKRGWLWIEEYCWHKRNCYPGKWSTRFRDAWERCLHFTKSRDFEMYQDAVKVPIGDWAEKRLTNLSKNDHVRDESRSRSGFGKKVTNWIGRELVYPTNVLHLATECSNKNHSAAFPEELPAWFIKLFTEPGDIVLDPFNGSGTTTVAAKHLDRHYIGIEKEAEYCTMAEEKLKAIPTTLF